MNKPRFKEVLKFGAHLDLPDSLAWSMLYASIWEFLTGDLANTQDMDSRIKLLSPKVSVLSVWERTVSADKREDLSQGR